MLFTVIDLPGTTIIDALMKGNANGSQEIAIVHISGLPDNVMAIDIVKFFEGTAEVLNGEDGVLLRLSEDGRTTGNGYVAFQTAEIAKAAMFKDYKKLFDKYITVSECSFSDALKVSKIPDES